MSNSLDVRALIAYFLLRHLEPAWAQLAGDHLLATVAPSLARGWFGDWTIVRQLDKVAHVKLFQSHPKIHHDIGSFGRLRVAAATSSSSETEGVKPEVTEKVAEGIAASAATLT